MGASPTFMDYSFVLSVLSVCWWKNGAKIQTGSEAEDMTKTAISDLFGFAIKIAFLIVIVHFYTVTD